jgi:tetrahydromethanopterin S-methyltransferase subunit A
MRLMIKKIEDGAGKLCKVLLPIKHQYYFGSGKAWAICTLSSFDLLEAISQSYLMDRVQIVGRLLSENKGIDAIIDFTISHPELRQIILCGKEVRGHKAGQALLALAHNGIDAEGTIIGADGPNPSLTRSAQEVALFRRQVQIIDLIGTADIDKIADVLVP